MCLAAQATWQPRSEPYAYPPIKSISSRMGKETHPPCLWMGYLSNQEAHFSMIYGTIMYNIMLFSYVNCKQNRQVYFLSFLNTAVWPKTTTRLFLFFYVSNVSKDYHLSWHNGKLLKAQRPPWPCGSSSIVASRAEAIAMGVYNVQGSSLQQMRRRFGMVSYNSNLP